MTTHCLPRDSSQADLDQFIRRRSSNQSANIARPASQIAYHAVVPASAMLLGRCPHFQARRRGRSANVRLRGSTAGDAVLAAERVFLALISTDQTARFDGAVGRDCSMFPGCRLRRPDGSHRNRPRSGPHGTSRDPRTAHGDMRLRFAATFGSVVRSLVYTGIRIRCWRAAAVKSDSL